MNQIIAITVSTNYDDILNIVLPQNYIFFWKWIIITSPDDKKTLDVIKKHNFPNVIPAFFNFYGNNKKFNKGGAIRYYQKKIASLNYTGNVLILDSDIYLPNDFLSIMKNIVVKRDTLYGTNSRNDYHSYDHFINGVVDEHYGRSHEIDGYFQLYKYEKTKLYSESENCSKCDLDFHRFFKNKVIIEKMNVKHLGEKCVNWNGRDRIKEFL